MDETQPYGCQEVLACLDDYLDQELPLDEVGRILRHLDACAECARCCERSYRILAEMRAAVQDLVLPETLSAQVRASLSPSWPSA